MFQHDTCVEKDVVRSQDVIKKCQITQIYGVLCNKRSNWLEAKLVDLRKLENMRLLEAKLVNQSWLEAAFLVVLLLFHM